mmetsp:Transcript_36857/g.47631  ORF Transcript_36857/g.47631 Transcript_36857/m.47631 type:complete len:741 (+) Transcript_36857:65-2287(+)
MASPLKGSVKLFPSLFSKPRGVTIIGASSKSGKIGNAIVQNIIQFGYPGNIYPVNAKSTDPILGLPAYTNVNNIEKNDCDLAIIVVPSKHVPKAIEDCGKKGIKGAVIISAGFKETGMEGSQLEKEVSSIASKYNMSIIGPNTLGIIDNDGLLNASFANSMPPKGNISFFSQSGAMCTSILDLTADQESVGFNKFISIGNKMDLNENDFLEYYNQDEKTKVITGYLEGVVNGKSFLNQASKVTPTKPVILIKSACTEDGSKAASSHTGTLAGSDLAYEVAFKQSGVIRVDCLEDLLGFSDAFSNQPLMSNNQVCVITNAGGPGILAADCISKSLHGLSLASLSEETKEKLSQVLPAAASYQNPIDVLGDAKASLYEKVIEIILKDDQIGSILVVLTPQTSTECDLTAKLLGELNLKFNHDEPTDSTTKSQHDKKTIMASFIGSKSVKSSWNVLNQYRIPNFYEPKHAVKALDAMWQYKKYLNKISYSNQQEQEEEAPLENIDKEMVSKVLHYIRHTKKHLATGGFEAAEVCTGYGINFPKAKVVTSVNEAVETATSIRYPVSLKIASTDILHKSKCGGVALNLKNEKQVHDAYELMMHRVNKAHPDANIQGIQVAYFAPQGQTELIIGISRDETFGSMIMVGIGGVLVESIKDVVFRVAPVNKEMAYEMLSEIKSQKLLNKKGPWDIEATVDTIMRVSQLSIDFPEIEEFDINPLMVYEPGKGTCCVDMRLRLSENEFQK